MDIADFYALKSGPAPQVDGEPATLRVVEAGRLELPSGVLEANDPFVSLGEENGFPVPRGSFPVYVTVADVSQEQDGSHEREAYLSVIFAEGEAAQVRPAISSKGAPPPGEFWAVGVDAGTVGFVDKASVKASMPDGDWYSDLFDNDEPNSWFDLMDSPDHIAPGIANIVMPLAGNGENVVLCHSGWGDGLYPVLATYSEAGKLLGIHIDLEVVGKEDGLNG